MYWSLILNVVHPENAGSVKEQIEHFQMLSVAFTLDPPLFRKNPQNFSWGLLPQTLKSLQKMSSSKGGLEGGI